MSIADEMMDTREFQVERVVRNLMLSVKELDAFRLSNEARYVLAQNLGDVELSRDKLSRILDDVGGK